MSNNNFLLLHYSMWLWVQSLIVNKMIQNDNSNHKRLFMLFKNPRHLSLRQQYLPSSNALLSFTCCSLNGCRSFVSFDETQQRRHWLLILIFFLCWVALTYLLKGDRKYIWWETINLCVFHIDIRKEVSKKHWLLKSWIATSCHSILCMGRYKSKIYIGENEIKNLIGSW